MSVRFGTAAGRWVLLVTVLGSGLGFLDATVVTVALPRIGQGLGVGLADLQWVLDSYLVTLAALILAGGAISDRYGRQRVFLVGVVWFCSASALCAAAPSVGVLIAARAVQGVGAALVTPGSLAIVESAFVPADRGRAIGAWSALTGIAGAAGPLLGGYLVDAFSWRAIFLINVPVGVVVVLIGARRLPESRDPPASGRLDLVGALLGAAALGGVTDALIGATGSGGPGAPVLAAGAAGLAAPRPSRSGNAPAATPCCPPRSSAPVGSSRRTWSPSWSTPPWAACLSCWWSTCRSAWATPRSAPAPPPCPSPC